MILTTQRLRIRPFELRDDLFILRLLNTPGWIKNIGDRKVYNTDDAQNYLLRGPIKSYHDHGFGLFCAELLETGEPVGMCGLVSREGLGNTDLGFAFLPEFQSRGLAFEAADEVLRFAFHDLQLNPVAAITLPTNAPCIHILTKLGMRKQKMIQLPHDPDELELFETRKKSISRPPFHEFPALESERLLLRDIQLDEAENLLEILFYNQMPAGDVSQAKQILRRIDRNYREGATVNWGIVERTSGELIGTIGYYRGFDQETGEVGFVMKEKFRRKGYIREALSLVIPFAYEKMHLSRVIAFAREDNSPSRTLLASSGFSETGHISENHVEYAFGALPH